MKKWFKEWDAIIVVYGLLSLAIIFQMYYIVQLKAEIKTIKNENRKRG
jgi:hypothetical protein